MMLVTVKQWLVKLCQPTSNKSMNQTFYVTIIFIQLLQNSKMKAVKIKLQSTQGHKSPMKDLIIYALFRMITVYGAVKITNVYYAIIIICSLQVIIPNAKAQYVTMINMTLIIIVNNVKLKIEKCLIVKCAQTNIIMYNLVNVVGHVLVNARMVANQ